MAYEIPKSFYDTLSKIESGNRPYVKAKTSSASGLYQFIKSTWQDFGGQWGTDPTKAFGGLTPSAEEQRKYADALTQQNAGVLDRSGISLSPASLYAAHFLGAGKAAKVLKSEPSQSLAPLVGSATMRANPQLSGFTVADFKNWLVKKTGSDAAFGTGGGSANASRTFQGVPEMTRDNGMIDANLLPGSDLLNRAGAAAQELFDRATVQLFGGTLADAGAKAEGAITGAVSSATSGLAADVGKAVQGVLDGLTEKLGPAFARVALALLALVLIAAAFWLLSSNRKMQLVQA